MKYTVKPEGKQWYIEGIPGRRIYYSTDWRAESYMNKQIELEAKTKVISDTKNHQEKTDGRNCSATRFTV